MANMILESDLICLLLQVPLSFTTLDTLVIGAPMITSDDWERLQPFSTPPTPFSPHWHQTVVHHARARVGLVFRIFFSKVFSDQLQCSIEWFKAVLGIFDPFNHVPCPRCGSSRTVPTRHCHLIMVPRRMGVGVGHRCVFRGTVQAGGMYNRVCCHRPCVSSFFFCAPLSPRQGFVQCCVEALSTQ